MLESLKLRTINTSVLCDPKWVYSSNIVFAPYVITYLKFLNSDAAGVNHLKRCCNYLFFGGLRML